MYVPPQTHFAIRQSADICTTALSSSPRESVSCIGVDKQAELGCWERGYLRRLTQGGIDQRLQQWEQFVDLAIFEYTEDDHQQAMPPHSVFVTDDFLHVCALFM